MIEHPLCNECGKEIIGIARLWYTLGVELPVHLHSSCYEKLKENSVNNNFSKTIY